MVWERNGKKKLTYPGGSLFYLREIIPLSFCAFLTFPDAITDTLIRFDSSPEKKIVTRYLIFPTCGAYCYLRLLNTESRNKNQKKKKKELLDKKYYRFGSS